MLSSSDRAAPGSKTIGTRCVSTFTGFSRRSARRAAVRPTSSAGSSPAYPRAIVYQKSRSIDSPSFATGITLIEQ
jgi:hypothetical protein